MKYDFCSYSVGSGTWIFMIVVPKNSSSASSFSSILWLMVKMLYYKFLTEREYLPSCLIFKIYFVFIKSTSFFKGYFLIIGHLLHYHFFFVFGFLDYNVLVALPIFYLARKLFAFIISWSNANLSGKLRHSLLFFYQLSLHLSDQWYYILWLCRKERIGNVSISF